MRTTSALFANATLRATANPHLRQWDFGQRLLIRGLSLPGKYEVHFCSDGDAKSILVTGYRDGVYIPDECLESGEDIFAYVYLHDGEKDGCTAYMITIPVAKRPPPQSRWRTIETTSEPESVFDYGAVLENQELRWTASAMRPFDHERCPRAEDEGVFDFPAFDIASGGDVEWSNHAGRPYDHPTPHGTAEGAFVFEEYAEESFHFITSAWRNAGNGNKLARPVAVFDFAEEQNSMSWSGNAKRE